MGRLSEGMGHEELSGHDRVHGLRERGMEVRRREGGKIFSQLNVLGLFDRAGKRWLTHRDHAVPFHHADLNVLRTSLDDLEQRLDRELDRLLPVELLGVVLLEKLADGLGRPANGAGLDLSAMAPGRRSSIGEVSHAGSPSMRSRSRSARSGTSEEWCRWGRIRR